MFAATAAKTRLSFQADEGLALPDAQFVGSPNGLGTKMAAGR